VKYYVDVAGDYKADFLLFPELFTMQLLSIENEEVAKDGIAAEATPNVEMVTIADLRTDTLIEARQRGAVRNLKDRRHDLYSVNWKK
jgi:predicted amidohydrolase